MTKESSPFTEPEWEEIKRSYKSIDLINEKVKKRFDEIVTLIVSCFRPEKEFESYENDLYIESFIKSIKLGYFNVYIPIYIGKGNDYTSGLPLIPSSFFTTTDKEIVDWCEKEKHALEANRKKNIEIYIKDEVLRMLDNPEMKEVLLRTIKDKEES